MKFAPRAVSQSEDCILAHSIKLEKKTLKKGHRLNKSDIQALIDSGYQDIIVASLDLTDVHEDAAVAELSAALAGKNVSVGKAFTGRANLHAEKAGLLVLNESLLNRINLIHESMTVATLEPFSLVNEKQMLATIKAIPFSVERRILDQCLHLIEAETKTIDIAPFKVKQVGFVQTVLAGTKQTVLDKTSKVLAERLSKLGCSVKKELRCEHNISDIAKALTELNEAEVDMLIVAGASAVVDRRDVVPAGIEKAGGSVSHFGMPVDPGNLLLLATLNDLPVLGMPGCARSPKENGFDWVLERQVAEIPVSREDIMLMGVGGLLKEIPGRIQPRASRAEQPPVTKGKMAALVLAAGKSSRMGAVNKLLIKIDGKTMVEHAVEAAGQAGINDIVVVTGHEQEKITAALKQYSVRFAHNPNYQLGISSSLTTGLHALGSDVAAALICLADMPRVSATEIKTLLAAFDPVEGREICVPIYQDKRGNPVLWSQRFFAEMAESSGDVGAKHLLAEYDELVCEVAMPDSAVLVDFDTEQALSDADYELPAQ